MYTHFHEYKFDSEPSLNHSHNIHGYTDYMVGINVFHIHFFQGVCNYKGHNHNFSGMTGLPVKTEYGHIHKMEGVLEPNESHKHKFNSYTFEDSSFINNKIARGANE